jgi:hypothetical protein
VPVRPVDPLGPDDLRIATTNAIVTWIRGVPRRLKPGFLFSSLIGTSGTRALPGFRGRDRCGRSQVNSRFLTGPSVLFGMATVVVGVVLFAALEALRLPKTFGGADGAAPLSKRRGAAVVGMIEILRLRMTRSSWASCFAQDDKFNPATLLLVNILGDNFRRRWRGW